MPDLPLKPERNRRFSLVDGMVFVAGLAVAFWAFTEPLLQAWRVPPPPDSMGFQPFLGWLDSFGYTLMVVGLGGLSLAGVPLLLRDRARRPPSIWGPGKTLWFASGTAAWLLWPPVVYQKLSGGNGKDVTAVCYFYGTPLMALYMALALWAGRSLRRRKRRRRVLGWQERFGLILGLAWACTGLYLLSMFYRIDLFRR